MVAGVPKESELEVCPDEDDFQNDGTAAAAELVVCDSALVPPTKGILLVAAAVFGEDETRLPNPNEG